MDESLMTYVTTGTLRDDLQPRERNRIVRQATWLRWERGKLYIVSGQEREVPPMWARRGLVESTAATLGFPGGERLFGMLRARYHWTGMKLDCIRWCSD